MVRPQVEINVNGHNPLIINVNWQWLVADDACQHDDILVAYHHPHGDLPSVPLSELLATDPAATRPIITLSTPRCQSCGSDLNVKSIRHRTQKGGDLYDPRFKWV